MVQFDVYENARASTADVQSDLVDVATRVVVPIIHVDRFGSRLTRLHPTIRVRDAIYVVSIADLAGLLLPELGKVVINAQLQQDEIVAALGLLLTGI